ncbi:hypothetical protein [Streptomyces syringium]|uniref:hypothetical protein n=1 Tax=Streptomyces syringium TaxID=76729 RepID=UPI003AB0F67A
MVESRLIGSYRALLPEVVAVRTPHSRLTGSVMAYVGMDLRLSSPLRRRGVASATPMLMIDFEAVVRRVSRLDGTAGAARPLRVPCGSRPAVPTSSLGLTRT